LSNYNVINERGEKMKDARVKLHLELGYPESFQADHKRCVSLNGSHNNIEFHRVIIFKGSLEECKKFIAKFNEPEIE